MSVLRALVVDDEPLARDELAFLLSEAGDVEVVGQADGAARALELGGSLAPDLVFVVAGSLLNGGRLAARLRRLPIEIPRLAATLPISTAAFARAKLAWIVAWATVFVAIPAAFAALRLL